MAPNSFVYNKKIQLVLCLISVVIMLFALNCGGGSESESNSEPPQPGYEWYVYDGDNDNYHLKGSEQQFQTGGTIPDKYIKQTSSLGEDCDDNDNTTTTGYTFYRDLDNDGYTDGTTTMSCDRPTDYKLASELTSTTQLDCNDDPANEGDKCNPGLAELVFDNQDNNCNGKTDEFKGKLIFHYVDNIWLKDCEEQNVTLLTQNSGGNYCPDISPDGNFFVCHSNRNGTNYQLVVGNTTGGPQTLITSGTFKNTEACFLENNLLAYSSAADANDTNKNICIINRDGTGKVQLTNDASYANLWPFKFGNRIGFASNRANGVNYEIWSMERNGTDLKQETALNLIDAPTTSVYGTQNIAAIDALFGSNWNIGLTEINQASPSTTLTQITYDPLSCFPTTWFNSEWVFHTKGDPFTTNSAIYLKNINTQQEVYLQQGAYSKFSGN